MSAWVASDVVANGIRTHYHRTGGGWQPLVLAHGITDSGLCWTALARGLEDAYDVLMLDARGHGLSDAPEEGYTWETLGEDLAGAIEALGVAPALLMGHSMGAASASLVAARRPDLVRGLVLEDPPWRQATSDPAARSARAEMFRMALEVRRARSKEDLVSECRQNSPAWSDEEVGPWAESKQQVSPHVASLFVGDYPDWREVAASITCPTLLLTADPERGAIVTPKVASEALSLMPNARVERVSDAGHSIHRDQPARVLALVREFLAGV